eukprot:365831-Chlamydomonas_euryale.AAC.11
MVVAGGAGHFHGSWLATKHHIFMLANCRCLSELFASDKSLHLAGCLLASSSLDWLMDRSIG